MKTPDPITRIFSLMLPMCAIALLAVQCSNNGPDASIETSSGTVEGQGVPTASNSNDATNGAHANGTPMTLAEERRQAAAELRGLRASMIAELEKTRARLNEGTGTNPYPERANDDEHASELAQGLERVDRALAAVDAATDETWGSARDVELKEVQEVRAWWRKYESDHVTVKK